MMSTVLLRRGQTKENVAKSKLIDEQKTSVMTSTLYFSFYGSNLRLRGSPPKQTTTDYYYRMAVE